MFSYGDLWQSPLLQALLPTPFACKSLCVWRSLLPQSQTWSPAAPSAATSSYVRDCLLLIRNAEWKPIRWRVPLASASCLPEWEVMLQEGGTLRCMKIQLWRYYKKRRDETEATTLPESSVLSKAKLSSIAHNSKCYLLSLRIWAIHFFFLIMK